MPRLLKNDSIRLIEASVEALGLAQLGICSFRKDDLKIENVRYSAEIGLIGASIELSMNSILIQAFGRKIIYREERFKTASEILHDFRNFLNQSSAATLFLTNGISDSQSHIKRLLELTNRFQLMIISRANGLHNGMGLSYEITASFFQEVSLFLNLISQSINYKPYLQKIPELVGISIDKKILVDDLYNKVNATKDTIEQKNLLSSLFLILPELPKELPEWIKCFERFNIAPKRNDIVYLVNALELANPVSLKKVKSGSQSIDVRIDNDNPNAIPISPQYLRTEFTQFKDQFYADISTANGRLNTKQLDLPPKSSVYKAFSIDFYETNILKEGTLFSAHQSWPIIVTALNVPKNNTNAPFWFMIRKTDDLGQLKAQLKKASKIGNSSLKNNVDIAISGIEKIEKNEGVDISEKFYKTIFDDRNKFATYLEKFHESYNNNKNHELGENYEDLLNNMFEERTHVGELLSIIIEDADLSSEQRKYWTFQLTQVMPEIEDLSILIEILNRNELANSHTNIRKTMRAIDFFLYGPRITPAPNIVYK
jgi:hypothetical protein